MTPAHLAARALTATTYVVLGWDAARRPGQRVDLAAGTLRAIRKVVPLPGDDETLVRANGAIQVAGGAMLGLNLFPRVGAAMLAASMIPTTVAGHAFWTVEDPTARKLQRVQFLKNAAMLGGLSYVYARHPSSPTRN